MINEEAIRTYLFRKFPEIVSVDITKLGAGVQGAGFLIEMKTPEGPKSYVVKGLFHEGLGHDYPSDRAAVFLLDLEAYGNLPRHVKAVDVLSEMEDGTVKPIGGGREYYLLMERGEGADYFKDLAGFAVKSGLDGSDTGKIKALASYLAEIHSLRRDSRALYWRKLRDTVGHGECLMGVFDTYPDGTLGYDEMAEIEKLCVDWRARLKPKTHRLCQIHGDFHPGNIWFRSGTDFILLDRSRGPWGEPADDLAALAINYIFFSVMNFGDVRAAYLEGLRLFFDEYVEKTGDGEICEVVAPFFAFRAAVVANPLFYPELSYAARRKIFNFTGNLLRSERFDTGMVNGYLGND